jgi:murein peptide amidase A
MGDVSKIQLAVSPAVNVVGSSIAKDAVVYTKPKNITVTLDKNLQRASGKLELIDGDKTTIIATQSKIDEQKVSFSWSEDLPREKKIRLSLEHAEAKNGSTLDEPYVTHFTTSGAPKVIGVNIGENKVAPDARVVVTFDQALTANIELEKFISLTGGKAIISRQGNNQIVLTLQNIPRCTAFTITVAKGILGENGLISKNDWKYTSRIDCRTTQIIGYSVKGKPIVAYFYGSGNTTILFNGGMHGSEPSGTYILQDFVTQLDNEAYKIPPNKQIVVVPNTNPDGIAANSRFNANGVNIDRNFPESDWKKDIVTAGGAKPGGGGPAPSSEPETRALANLTANLKPRLTVSYHSQGSALGHNGTGDAPSIASAYAKDVGYRMFDNAESELGYEFTGEYEGWIAEKLGLPAILIELPNHTGKFLSKHESTMWKIINL